MTRKEYCPNCKRAVVGLYQNIRLKGKKTANNNPKFKYVRRAFYCKNCEIVLLDHQVYYKKITFEKS